LTESAPRLIDGPKAAKGKASLSFDAGMADNGAMRTMTTPVTGWLLPWLMLLALFMGALHWAKTAPPANLFLAADALIAHTRNPLPLQKNSPFAQKNASDASVGTRGEIPVVESALPNAERAVIDTNKITRYALDPAHPVGGDKAVVFNSALGYNQSNAGELIAKIQEGVRTNPAVLGKADQFGQRFTVDMPITGSNGNTVTVRTGWIFDPGSTTPRLTTLYVK
jgi:hypothetical protein